MTVETDPMKGSVAPTHLAPYASKSTKCKAVVIETGAIGILHSGTTSGCVTTVNNVFQNLFTATDKWTVRTKVTKLAAVSSELQN